MVPVAVANGQACGAAKGRLNDAFSRHGGPKSAKRIFVLDVPATSFSLRASQDVDARDKPGHDELCCQGPD
jgi:hypothetical protein